MNTHYHAEAVNPVSAAQPEVPVVTGDAGVDTLLHAAGRHLDATSTVTSMDPVDIIERIFQEERQPAGRAGRGRGVFINYRGEGSHGVPLLYAELARQFGPDRVFLDNQSTSAGTDVVEELLDQVRSCRVLLAVIGPRWLTTTDSTGRRRIDNPADWIRRELAEAFTSGVRVIPVLIDQAEIPTAADLPADIAALSRCQHRRLRRHNLTADLARIVTDLTSLDPERTMPAGNGEGRAWFRLTQAERDALTAAGHVKVWRPGEILALPGSPPTSMFVILRGWVKISATNYRGDDAPFAARGPAEIVGELGPISDLPRTATVQAIDEVHALVVAREKLVGILRSRPHIAEELLRMAAIRLRQSDRLRLESGGPDFPQRLAAVLLELALKHAPDWVEGKQVELHFNQGELADFARVSRSTLARGLEELRKVGAVRTARQRITIMHPAILRELAAGRPW